MKYIKIYENLDTRLKVNNGDYVIIKIETSTAGQKGVDFINNNIGQIVHKYSFDDVKVAYDNVPDSINNWFHFSDIYEKYVMVFNIDNIVAFSSTKEELEIISTANKYNL